MTHPVVVGFVAPGGMYARSYSLSHSTIIRQDGEINLDLPSLT